MAETSFDLGKKVFFLYPHKIVEEYIHLFLIKNEFEVYLVNDHRNFEQILLKYPNSVIFINIDEVLSEAEWIQYVQNLLQKIPSLVISIFSIYQNPELEKKLVNLLGRQAELISLRAGMEKTRQLILDLLVAQEARGRRRYLRYHPQAGQATLNLKYLGQVITGTIYDISSVGISMAFDENFLDLAENTRLKDVQIVFKGIRIKVDMVVTIKRAQPGKKTTYVMLFDQNTLPTDKEKIHTCILRGLQSDIEKWLDEMPKK
jgi:hypothetical protein